MGFLIPKPKVPSPADIQASLASDPATAQKPPANQPIYANAKDQFAAISPQQRAIMQGIHTSPAGIANGASTRGSSLVSGSSGAGSASGPVPTPPASSGSLLGGGQRGRDRRGGRISLIGGGQ